MRTHKHLIQDIVGLFRRILPAEGLNDEIVTVVDGEPTWISPDDLHFNVISVGDLPDQVVISPARPMEMKGDTTVWEDIQNSLIGRRLASTAGKVDYDYLENTIVFSPSGSITNLNDTVHWSIQRPHKSKDSTMNVHIHWEQSNVTVRTWTLWYRIQNNGDAKTTAWTAVSVNTGGASDAFPYVSGTLNQITRLADIDVSSAGLSATVQFRLARTDANAGDIAATFVDAHYEVAYLGSDEEFVL